MTIATSKSPAEYRRRRKIRTESRNPRESSPIRYQAQNVPVSKDNEKYMDDWQTFQSNLKTPDRTV